VERRKLKQINDVDTTKTITHIGLCAGYGGIELGLARVLPNLRSVALCEIEAFPIANLVAKMEAGLMDAAPIWTDLKTFPWESFRDRVDILTGGYPCQPFSAAGKRAGKEDPRHLWPWIADGIRILRPRVCFFENVEGHISLGLREVIGELEEIGYTTAWGIFSAREVGAPHQRKRVFILAVSSSFGGAAGLPRSLAWNEGFAGVTDNGGGEGCGELENPECIGWRGWSKSGAEIRECRSTKDQVERSCSLASSAVWPSRPGEPQHAWEPPRVVGNAESEQSSSRDHRGEQGSPCESEQVEFRGGDCGTLRESNGETQPTLGGNSDGSADWMDYAKLCVSCDNRTDELRLLGNGVVPATAERAFRTLIEELL
jgi:DNA (cytosine-5)-methyltransferase 1